MTIKQAISYNDQSLESIACVLARVIDPVYKKESKEIENKIFFHEQEARKLRAKLQNLEIEAAEKWLDTAKRKKDEAAKVLVEAAFSDELILH